MQRLLHPRRDALTLLLLALATAALSACGSSDDSSAPIFDVKTATPAVAATTPIHVHGDWIAFLADEAATGQDLNGDGDLIDSVAWVVNSASGVETNVGVATRELAWLGNQLFLAVDESDDGKDWGGAPGMGERVLLRWSPGAAVQFVDVLSQSSPRAMAVVDSLLFYASGNAPAGPHESTLRVIERPTPDVPREVLTDDATGPLSPLLLGAQGGIVFLALDETVEQRDLNGDGDALDEAVLALLDGQGAVVGMGYDKDLLNTELAMPGLSAPLRARAIAAGGRAVGFLVNEEAQGQTNLNAFGPGTTLPASWLPPQCVNDQDVDTDDDVLHYVLFDAWQANPVASPPQNTGICGAQRILMTSTAVGTISPEWMEGTCALNGDGDQDDHIFRWIRFGQAPVTDVDLLLALDTAVAGPARGVAELAERFVIQVDEEADGRDHDGDPSTDRMLLAWLNPASPAPVWTFDQDPSPAQQSFATSTWIGEIPGRMRLGVAFAESSHGFDLNGDGDVLDSVPTFARFDTTGPARLVFPGIAFATSKHNAGIEVVSGWGFYRISEAEDSRDWTGDGQLNAMVLLTTNLTSGQTVYLGPLNALARRAVEAQPDGAGVTAAFIVSEAFAGDLNGNGVATDHLVRYIRF